MDDQMFVNISNHPSARWGEKQLEAAIALGGEIRDISFPNVSPTMASEEVLVRALDLAAQTKPGDIVMCQGEFTLTYMTTSALLRTGREVVVACTERKVQERELEGGKVEKTTVFEFVQFRRVI